MISKGIKSPNLLMPSQCEEETESMGTTRNSNRKNK